VLSSFPLIEIQGPLSIASLAAYAFDVLAVYEDFIKGMVAKVRQGFRMDTDGP
jgi:hypothetical protein